MRTKRKGGCKRKKCQSYHLVIWSRNHEYSVLSRKDLSSYYQSMGLEFRYALGKVLGIQDHQALRLASRHCVLRPNLIKNMFNTCIYTHTHTSIHLSIQSWHHSSQNTYLSTLKQKRAKHKRNPSIHLTRQQLKHGSKTLTYYTSVHDVVTQVCIRMDLACVRRLDHAYTDPYPENLKTHKQSRTLKQKTNNLRTQKRKELKG